MRHPITIRDLLWITLVVALLIVSWISFHNSAVLRTNANSYKTQLRLAIADIDTYRAKLAEADADELNDELLKVRTDLSELMRRHNTELIRRNADQSSQFDLKVINGVTTYPLPLIREKLSALSDAEREQLMREISDLSEPGTVLSK